MGKFGINKFLFTANDLNSGNVILKHGDIFQSIIVLLDLFRDSAQECGTVVLKVLKFSLTTHLRLLYMNVFYI